jgi:predicted nucleotidyltransferase
MTRDGLQHLNQREQAAVQEFLSVLQAQHGQDVLDVILFGSKARGDSDPESDLDLLVIVEEREQQLWQDIISLETALLLKYDTVISSLIMSRDNYEWHRQHRAPLYRNVHREGIKLWTRAPAPSSISA